MKYVSSSPCRLNQVSEKAKAAAHGSTPNAFSAAATALAVTSPTEIIPPLLPPLAPRSLIGEGCVSVTSVRMVGKSLAVGRR